MKLVIAEKPSAGKDIARILGATQNHHSYMEGNGYIVSWAYGHLIEVHNADLEKKNWAEIILPCTTPITHKETQFDNGKAQLAVLKGLIAKADEIINAGDAGREGELIQREIYDFCNYKKSLKRLWISSLTDDAIKEGFNNLKDGKEYDNLYKAGLARSYADFYAGLNFTTALSLAVHSTLPLGRVQTPTLAMICKRHLDNKNFVPVPYWIVQISTQKDNIKFSVKPKDTFKDKTTAESFLTQIKNEKDLKVLDVKKEEKREPTPLLFDLTALQKEANRKYGMTADKVLESAQSLYEKKHLSYPRTGSAYIPEDVFDEMPDLIKKVATAGVIGLNVTYYSANPALSKRSVNAAKVTDHHALLPTNNLPNIKNLSADDSKVYMLVIQRMFEAFHTPCIKEKTSVKTSAANAEFFATGTVIKSAGWREVAPKDEKDSGADEKDDAQLPILAIGDILPIQNIELKEDKTKPAPILTEASLLALMETAGSDIENEEEREAIKDCGIGTPATRAEIIKKLFTRKYITADGKKLIPTQTGLFVYEIVKDKLIGSPKLTGNWEKKLNDIAAGKLSFDIFMTEIKTFIAEVVKELSAVKATGQISQGFTSAKPNENAPMCPKCKKRHLRILPKGIVCDKNECGFALWKGLLGKELTDNQLTMLITNGETGIIKGFKNKAGKEFNAKLVLNKDFKIDLDFGIKK